MSRKLLLMLLTGILLLASCTPQETPVPTGTPPPSATPVLHAPEIRFALIGEPRDVNVWELFDESGASYADYALRSEYWPRLYHLAPPEFTFEAQAAEGMPSPVIPEGEFFSATVSLRKDLKWTDGTPFTADDVAFTVNNALAFELGFDWSAYYPLEYIERVDVVDTSTVKFIFKQQPNVGIWQYGPLQGPIVQKAFWEPRILEATSLLPEEALHLKLETARGQLRILQARVDELSAQANTLVSNGQDNRTVLIELDNQQNNLIFAQNTLDKILEQATGKLNSGRQALYAVDDTNEPTLGTWMPAGKENGAWVNEANPDFPFIHPNFDQAVYLTFTYIEDAETAFEENQVDAILYPSGDRRFDYTDITESMSSLDGNLHVLIFNPANMALADPSLRQALTCMIEPSPTPRTSPVSNFILPGNDFWQNVQATTPCSDLDTTSSDTRVSSAVQILQSAGYTWQQIPLMNTPGSGLALPDGSPFPVLGILVPPDQLAGTHAWGESEQVNQIIDAAQELGIQINHLWANYEDTRYRVLSSKQYDMAILGWNLSLYPGYLCEWFGVGGQFNYGSERLQSECQAFAVESNLDVARNHILQIQSILIQDLPFIPLYADVRYDAYRNVQYPFESVLGGLGSLYGAPSYAMPAP